MGPNPENRLTVSAGGQAAPETALVTLAAPEGASVLASSTQPVSAHEERLGGMSMRLDVMVKVPSFCVRDLLALERGTVVETEHDHTQDIPIQSGGALLAWAEFEVVNEGLAVRLTRLG